MMTILNNVPLKPTETNVFGFLFSAALIAALFYTGNNTWSFSASFIFLSFTFALVLRQRFYQSINMVFDGTFISAILLLSWFAISIFPSQIKYLTLYNFFWVGSLLIVFFIFSFNEKKDQVWKIIWPIILFLVLSWAIYGLIQYYYLHIPPNATFLNRNSLAALINLALIPASGYFLLHENNRPWRTLTNKTLASILIILFLSIFIIASRGAFLSLGLGFMILLVILRKHVDKSQLYSLFIIVFISFLLATLSQYFISSSPESITERMTTLTAPSKAGDTRFLLWESLIPLFKEMPWYGFGLGSLWVFWPPHRPASDHSAGFFAHNDYMQITLEAGYPGIILLLSLFIFILLSFIRTLKRSSDINNSLTLLQRVELVSLFSALTTFAAHSFFTYNFYILPLLLIAGLYLGRFNQLVNINSSSLKNIPALKRYFKPFMFYLSFTGIILILSSYFLTVSLSGYYNSQAKELMLKGKYQAANTLYLRAQTLTPLMDNPFFSHADLLRRGANKLLSVEKVKQANSLLKLAHINLDKAEKLNPLRPQTHHIRGLIYLQKQPEKAKIEFIKALKLDPRFLFSRIRLAQLLHKEQRLKKAIEVLYEGVDYNYPVNRIMLEYMTLFAKYSREAGVESFALHLEDNIKRYKNTRFSQ